jgi:hypothetical protein
MRCKSCDCALTDYEATIRSVYTREFLNMCKVCLESIKTDVVAVGNVKLMSEDSSEEVVDEISGLIDNYPDDDYFEDRWNER